MELQLKDPEYLQETHLSHAHVNSDFICKSIVAFV